MDLYTNLKVRIFMLLCWFNTHIHKSLLYHVMLNKISQSFSDTR